MLDMPRLHAGGDDGDSRRIGAIEPARMPAPRRSARVDPLSRGELNRGLLRLLVATRLAMTFIGAGLVLALWRRPAAELPWLPIAVIGAGAAALSMAAFHRLRQGLPIGEGTFLVHVLGDVAMVTYALAATGGIENPLLGFYMLPLSLAAYALTGARLGVALAAVLGALLLLFGLPDSSDGFTHHSRAHEASELVSLGLMALTAFMVSTLLRRHQRAVLQMREDAVGEQSALALGTLAVQAADAISTPLATMSVLVHEIRQGRLATHETRIALDELTAQIARCKGHLSDLLASAGRPRAQDGARCAVDELVRAAARQCELLSPDLRVVVEPTSLAAPDVLDESSLLDALVLLIEHRGREAPRHVRAALDWTDRTIVVSLYGTAGTLPAAQEVNDPMVALAASLIARWSGTVTSECMGAVRCSRIELPRHAFGVGAHPPES